MPEGFRWPRCCISCGEMDPQKLENIPYTYSKSYQSGNYLHTISLPIDTYVCVACGEIAKKKFLIKLATYFIPAIIWLIIAVLPALGMLDNSTITYYFGPQMFMVFLLLLIPLYFGIKNRHKFMRFMGFKYNFGQSRAEFDFKTKTFTKIFKDFNPHAYVRIRAQEFLPLDYESAIPKEGPMPREISVEEAKELKMLARSKDGYDDNNKIKVVLQEDLPDLILKNFISRDKRGHLQSAIAERRGFLSLEILRILSTKGADVRLSLAMRKKLPLEIINRLLRDSSPRVREAIYNNYIRNVEITIGQQPEMVREEQAPPTPTNQPFQVPEQARNEKKCPSCGSSLGNQEFCPNCGRFLAD